MFLSYTTTSTSARAGMVFGTTSHLQFLNIKGRDDKKENNLPEIRSLNSGFCTCSKCFQRSHPFFIGITLKSEVGRNHSAQILMYDTDRYFFIKGKFCIKSLWYRILISHKLYFLTFKRICLSTLAHQTLN